MSVESKLPPVIFGGCGAGPAANDPFAQGQHHLYGFLESFLMGRRLLPGLCILLRRLQRMPPEERLLVFRPFQRLICTLLSCTGGPQFLAADTSTISSMQLGVNSDVTLLFLHSSVLLYQSLPTIKHAICFGGILPDFSHVFFLFSPLQSF